MFTNHVYLMYMYKEDLALNNLQWLQTKKYIAKYSSSDNTLPHIKLHLN